MEDSEDIQTSCLNSKSRRDHAADPNTRRVGILVGVVGILLSVVTIASHRAHTDAVIHRTEANDQWSYYQAKKIRENTEEVALSLMTSLGTDPAKTESLARKLEAARAKYAADAEKIQDDASAKDEETEERGTSRAVFRHRRRVAGTRTGVVLVVFFGAQGCSFRSSACSRALPARSWASWVSCFEKPDSALFVALAVLGARCDMRGGVLPPTARRLSRVEARSNDLLAVAVVRDDKMIIHLSRLARQCAGARCGGHRGVARHGARRRPRKPTAAIRCRPRISRCPAPRPSTFR